MNTQFKEFFFSKKIDFSHLKDDTLIIFDTNTLLNIYRYSNETRDELIKAMQKIQKHIWVPYQVMLEFNLLRRKTMHKLNNEKNEVKNLIDKSHKDYSNSLTDTIRKITLRSSDVSNKKQKAIEEINKHISKLKEEILNYTSEILSSADSENDLMKEIAKLFITKDQSRLGNPYSQEKIDEIVTEGKKRYELNIPPGYKDSKKDGTISYNGVTYDSSYGDLIIWNQILDHTKEKKYKSVIFITDDSKEDWWYILGGKRLGPRAELKNEMLRIANADFFMLNSNSFLQQVNSKKEDYIDEANIKERDSDFSLTPLYSNEYNEENLFNIYKNHSNEPNSKNLSLSYNLNDYIPNFDINNLSENLTWLENAIEHEKLVLRQLTEAMNDSDTIIQQISLYIREETSNKKIDILKSKLNYQLQRREQLNKLLLHQNNKLHFFNHEISYFENIK